MTHPVVIVARKYIGMHEATGKNDGRPLEVFGLRGEDPLPWCARGVRHCFKEAGRPLPGNEWMLGSVSYMESIMKDHDWLLSRGVHPEPGDIIFFGSRGPSDPGPGRHVGLVEKVDLLQVHTIEFNVGNAVARCKHLLSNKRITGYGRVPFPS